MDYNARVELWHARRKILVYPLSASQNPKLHRTLHNSLHHLAPHLPQTLPIYRRLQFGNFSESSTLLTNIDLSRPDNPEEYKPWFVAYADRDARPETQVYVWASWEEEKWLMPEEEEDAQALLKTTLEELRGLSAPKASTDDTAQALTHESRQMIETGARKEDVLVFGGLHPSTYKLLQQLNVFVPKDKNTLVNNYFTQYYLFIFDTRELPPARNLPTGFCWGEITQQHFDLIKSRTSIPRQDRTLLLKKPIGIFPENQAQPIAWGFISVNASLSTLHVEPEFRGRGFAKALALKLLKEKMYEGDLISEARWNVPEGEERSFREALGFAFVGVNNEESKGVMRACGAKQGNELYWAGVDLSVLP